MQRLSILFLIFMCTVATPSAAKFSGASDAEMKEMVATFINLNGLLCASVEELRPLKLKDQWEVTCIEYRGGTGTVRYIFNARTGIAFKS